MIRKIIPETGVFFVGFRARELFFIHFTQNNGHFTQKICICRSYPVTYNEITNEIRTGVRRGDAER